MPAWSPDGTHLSFTFSDSTHELGIYIARPTISTSLNLLWPTGGYSSWSPDGERIAVNTFGVNGRGDSTRLYAEVAIIQWPSRESKVVYRSVEEYDADPFGLAWSPDGARLAFSIGWKTSEGLQRALFTINADGTGLHRSASTVEFAWQPAWTPDGKWIVFINGVNDTRSLSLVSVDQDCVVRTNIRAADALSISFRSDRLAYECASRICIIELRNLPAPDIGGPACDGEQ